MRYETKLIEVHGQMVRVKVYPPGKAVGSGDGRYTRRNETGQTLATRQELSKARWDQPTPSVIGEERLSPKMKFDRKRKKKKNR